MKKVLMVLVALAVPFLTLTSGWTQEDVEGVEGLEAEAMEGIEAAGEVEDVTDHEFAYGVLVSKTDNQLTISEYNFDTGADENVVYTVNADTEYEGGVTLADLQEGEEVEVLFLAQGDQKIAVLISAPLPSDETDMGDQPGYEASGEYQDEGNEILQDEAPQMEEGVLPDGNYDG